MEPVTDPRPTLRLTPDVIERARDLIRDRLPPTPLRRSFALRPANAWLKLECLWEHRDLIDEVLNVPEPALEEAIVALLADDQVVAEGSGALPVAALRCGLLKDDGRATAFVITGGNIDVRHLRRLLTAKPA